jgi:hypothetical protein
VEAYLLVPDHPLLCIAALLLNGVQGHLDAPLILPSHNGLMLQVNERQCPSADPLQLRYHPMSHTFSFLWEMSLSLLLVMYEISYNIFSKTTSLLQSLKFQSETLIPNCIILIFRIKQHDYTTEFMGKFFLHYLRFPKIFTEISAESPLYREVPSYWLSSCTHLILTSQSYRNHNKSNSTIYSRT